MLSRQATAVNRTSRLADWADWQTGQTGPGDRRAIAIGSVRRTEQFVPTQQLGNVGLRNFGGRRQTSLLNPQFFESLIWSRDRRPQGALRSLNYIRLNAK